MSKSSMLSSVSEDRLFHDMELVVGVLQTAQVLSYRIVSYHIISYHIISYHINRSP